MALSRSPQLAELLNHARDRWAADLRVALPARVEKYDSEKQLVDVQPLVKDRFESPDGTKALQLPVITNVPMMFPGAGGYSITFPVQKGDEVLLVFSDKSIDAWQDQGGVTDPDDARRHHLTDAVAIPGLHNNTKAIASINTSVLTLGKDGEDEDWVALSTKTKDEITKVRDKLDGAVSKLNSLVNAFNTAMTSISSHTHSVVISTLTAPASTALSTLGTPAPSTATAPSSVSDIKSDTVKIKG